jgi:hypothetical protein|tara:strand:- start:1420 stop:2064 length:645 start_codon:yes stop_codon:yes gene_type:complete
MIVHEKLDQKSLEWFEVKWGKIGGTLSKGLHTKGDTLFIDLLSQHIEEFEPSDSWENEHTKRGNDLEPFAIEYLEKYTGYKFKQFGWLQSEENELLGISPDGLIEDLTIACETKCFARKKHTEILLTREIPLDNIHQLVHYFTVNPKLEELYFCAFRPEAVTSFVKRLTLNSEVNIGTKAKPRMFTIKEVVELSKSAADNLLDRINISKGKLNF